jgi:glutamate decarboxylase
MPANAQSVRSLRIVIRAHLNRNVIDQLAEDIIKACQFLEKNGGNMKPPELHANKSSPKC